MVHLQIYIRFVTRYSLLFASNLFPECAETCIGVQQHLLKSFILLSPVNSSFFLRQGKSTFQLDLDVVSSCNFGCEFRATLNISQVQGFHLQNTGFKSISNFSTYCRCATIDKTLQEPRQINTSTWASLPTPSGSQEHPAQVHSDLPNSAPWVLHGWGKETLRRLHESRDNLWDGFIQQALTPKHLITQLRKLEEQEVGERKAPFKETANQKTLLENKKIHH